MTDGGKQAAERVAQAWQNAVRQGLDRLDAQLLLAYALGLHDAQARAWLLAHDGDPIPPAAGQRYAELVARRAAGEPLAYLVGQKEFYGLPLAVSPSVLVPRPDTETLVEWAVELLKASPPGARVVDLGTGSGAIALGMKHAVPQAQVTAVDVSDAALAVAEANGERLGLAVRWLAGSWFEPLAGPPAEQFELIVSNPPYIAQDDPHLVALHHEPPQALASGPDGLDALRHIVQRAGSHLGPGGWLLLEHGYEQAPAVQALLRATGYTAVSTRHDLAGHPRCTGGQRP